MLSVAMLLVFIAAILHVTWNVKLQSTRDPLDVTTRAVTLGLIILLPFMVVYWVAHGMPALHSHAIFFGFLSGLAELGYFFFLSYAYKHGQLSVVYPIARGSAPVLTFLFGVLILQETVNSYQLVGVLSLLAGIWLVRSAQVHGTRGVIPAFATGLFIALYTVIDKVGLAYANPVVFGGLKYFFTVLCMTAAIPLRHWLGYAPAKGKQRTSWATVALIGVAIIATYQLVLFALTMAPVAIISPLRESASVVVTILGIWKLREREGLARKVIGVVSIFVGMVLLAI